MYSDEENDTHSQAVPNNLIIVNSSGGDNSGAKNAKFQPNYAEQ